MKSIEDIYQFRCAQPSDINEHLPVIKEYASKCESIVELGVREMVSTWALLAGKPKEMLAVDIVYPKEFDVREVEEFCKEEGVDFKFTIGDSLEINIPQCDLLLIDTLHEAAQLEVELKRHANNVLKYIIFHDTVSCESELMPVINEWLKQGEWRIKEHYLNNNGLLVCERI